MLVLVAWGMPLTESCGFGKLRDFEQDGGHYLQVRYGARVISIDGQNNAVFVETLEELGPIYDTLIEVTKSGALDDVIERALARKPKYKPGAAKTAELHKLSKT